MKKKFLGFALLLCLIIPCAFMFAGCGNSNEDLIYAITVNQNLHGTISVDKETAKEGETVTITTAADEGYTLYAVLCDGVIVTSSTVTMPAKDIVISAIFKQIEQGYTLKQGNFIQASEATRFGDYVRQYSFYNTITVKDNNLMDLYVQLDSQFLQLNDISYLQDRDVITANVGGTEFKVKVVDSETFTLDFGVDSLIVFCYQTEYVINDGNYRSSYSKDESIIQLDVSINGNNITYTTTGEDSTPISSEEGTIVVRGSNIFLDFEDRYVFAKPVRPSDTSGRVVIKWIFFRYKDTGRFEELLENGKEDLFMSFTQI